MAKSKKKSSPDQMELKFDKPNFIKLNQEIKHLTSKAIAGCDKSRWQIVEELNEMVGREITVTTLNHWTAESKASHRISPDIIPAFCISTNDFDLIRLLSNACGGKFLESQEAILAEIARLEKQVKKIEIKKQELTRLYYARNSSEKD